MENTSIENRIELLSQKLLKATINNDIKSQLTKSTLKKFENDLQNSIKEQSERQQRIKELETSLSTLYSLQKVQTESFSVENINLGTNESKSSLM